MHAPQRSVRIVVAGFTATALIAPTVPAAAAKAPVVGKNLIRNGGAEATGKKPTPGGDKVPVTGWTVSKKSNLTAVRYGASGFPERHSPGPKIRGKNFFAGGVDGATNLATQRDSLKSYATWVATGRAHFMLSGWLGGYSDQHDHCVVRISWLDAKGKSLGTAHIGPVSDVARKDVTALLHRTTSGTVPKHSASVLVTIKMTRTDGVYNDGYADDLSLKLVKG